VNNVDMFASYKSLFIVWSLSVVFSCVNVL